MVSAVLAIQTKHLIEMGVIFFPQKLEQSLLDKLVVAELVNKCFAF
jgi:hypothetical protein